MQDPLAELEKLLADPQHQEQHCRRYRELAAQEVEAIVERLRHGQGPYLAERGVAATPARLQMMAERCQEDNAEPRSVCDIFVDRVNDIRQCAAELSRRCEIRVAFSEEAIDHILSRQLSGDAIKKFCEELDLAFEYGLRLLSEKKGIDEVVITAEGVDAPNQFINDLVSKNFQLE